MPHRHKSGILEHMLVDFSSIIRFVSPLGLLFVLTIPSTAQALSTPSRAHERTALAEGFTTEKLWKWQQRLNLQSWNISVAVARASELKPKTLGNIHWDSERKTAI